MHPGVAFQALSRAELDHELSPSRWAKDALGVLARHEAATAALAADAGLLRMADVAYGTGERQRLDITLPAAQARELRPALVFVHGGFWQEGHKAGSGFAAAACAREGWAHIGLGYTLAPQARLADIVAEVAQAARWLQAHGAEHGIDARRLLWAGHSAGGHLVAALLAGLGGSEAAGAVAGALLISGVYDLGPVAASYVNDAMGLEAAEARRLSPLFLQPPAGVPVKLLIGADEPPAFQRQTAALQQAWGLPPAWVAPGRDHFDVLDELAAPPAGPLQALRAAVSAKG